MRYESRRTRSADLDYTRTRESESQALRRSLSASDTWINKAVELLRDMGEHCPVEYADTVRLLCGDDVAVKAMERGKR